MMGEEAYKIKEAPTCPHCKEAMQKMDSRYLDWGTTFLWVCFNDKCQFFQKGWKHMMDNYGQLVSYRYMVTPDTGTQGVIPAFSHEYLRTEGKSQSDVREFDDPTDGPDED